MAGESSFGAQFWLDDADGDLTRVANSLIVPPPALQTSAIDVTDHDSEDSEFIASGRPPIVPEMSVTIHRQAGSTKDALLFAAVGSIRSFANVEKKGDGTLHGHQGEAVVIGYNPDGLEIDGKKTGVVTLQPTGAITRTTFTPPAP
jgi:hypothetical protein